MKRFILFVMLFMIGYSAFAATEAESVTLKVNRDNGTIELRALIKAGDLIPLSGKPMSKDQVKEALKRIKKAAESYASAEIEQIEKREDAEKKAPKVSPPPSPAEVVPLPAKKVIYVTPPWPPVGTVQVIS